MHQLKAFDGDKPEIISHCDMTKRGVVALDENVKNIKQVAILKDGQW